MSGLLAKEGAGVLMVGARWVQEGLFLERSDGDGEDEAVWRGVTVMAKTRQCGEE